MSRAQQENVGSCLEWIFKTPRKLSFEKLYRYYFDFILRLLYRVIVFEGIPDYLQEFDCNEREMTKFVIGTMGTVDPPLTPAARGSRDMMTRSNARFPDFSA